MATQGHLWGKNGSSGDTVSLSARFVRVDALKALAASGTEGWLVNADKRSDLRSKFRVEVLEEAATSGDHSFSRNPHSHAADY